MKVSFDFDSTLTTPKMQELCKKFLDLGADVRITTSRSEQKDNSDLFELAEQLGIEKVVFTNYQDKSVYLNDCDMHFDDDEVEIEEINHRKRCIGVLVNQNKIYNF